MTSISSLQVKKGKSQMLKRIYDFCDSLITVGAYVAGVLILLTTFMIFYEVVSRGLFGQPTIWATELSIYAIIGSCFFGSAYAVRKYAHITVDLLINAVNDKWKTVFAYISNSLGLLYSIVFTIYGFSHCLKTYELGITSSSLLRVPMYLPEMILPFGGVLMIIAFVLQLVDGGIHKGGDHL